MNKIQIHDFIDLHAWQESHKVVVDIYKLTKKFPKDELFGLTSQMRRSAVSITSNIAEGFGRHTYKERAQFYCVARGSVSELKNQLLISRDISHITDSEYKEINDRLSTSHQLLQGLITKTRSFISHSS